MFMRVTGSKSKWELAGNLNGYRYLFFFLRGVSLSGNWRVISTVTVTYFSFCGGKSRQELARFFEFKLLRTETFICNGESI